MSVVRDRNVLDGATVSERLRESIVEPNDDPLSTVYSSRLPVLGPGENRYALR